MNRILKIGIISLGLTLFLNVFAAVNTNAQVVGPLKDIVNRMDKFNKSLSSFQSDLTVVDWQSQLDQTDTRNGTVSYLPKTSKHPMYARIDWTKPDEQMAVIGDRYEMYRPRLNQVIRGKTDSAKTTNGAGGALAFMSMSKAQLQANYTVRYVGQETIKGGTPTWHLELTPKGRTSYKQAELWVDSDGLPRQAKVIKPNDDTMTVLLENVKTNVTIKADIFKLKYPSNIKPIEG